MDIHWYPGHMAKTRRLVLENMKLVDVVIEVLDARIPSSSRNPEINKIGGQKPRLVVLNKSGLADPEKPGSGSIFPGVRLLRSRRGRPAGQGDAGDPGSGPGTGGA